MKSESDGDGIMKSTLDIQSAFELVLLCSRQAACDDSSVT
jgi:hypothetical protein